MPPDEISWPVLNGKLDALEKLIVAKFEALDREEKLRTLAVFTAKEEIDRRLTEHNSLREQMVEQATTFVSSTEYDIQHRDVLTRVENLQALLNTRFEEHNRSNSTSFDTLEKHYQARFDELKDVFGNRIARVERSLWMISGGLTVLVFIVGAVVHFIGPK